MKDCLFEPIKINSFEIKNRINMPAMNLNYCDEYHVTDKLIDFYAERAKGGAGMLTVGCATVDTHAGGHAFIGAHDDAFIPGLKRLANGIKDNGSAAFIQLNHLGRYAFSKDISNQEPYAPSAVASRLTRETPHALSLEEIAQVIDNFVQAARRVKEAGFDGLEVLCGTGYLISEFLSPITNQRTDAYGGSLENRMRFGLEIIEGIREMIGPQYPVIVRMNGNDFMPEGNSKEELQTFGKALVAAGADALNINVGWHEARIPQVVTAVPRGVYAYLARGMKELVDVPVMSGHRINDPVRARELIGDNLCDMVCMGRALIADPYLPAKAMAKKESEILHCVACGQGCFDHVFMVEKPVECLCNPKAGRERACQVDKTGKPLRIMVVGGGPAGMSAALSAAECGHSVSLYEATDRLGGQLFLAGSPPGREEFANLGNDLAKQVALSDIRVNYNQMVDRPLLEKEAPDAVILASGATPITPPIAGSDLAHVVQAWDVLQDKVATGRQVVVVGGGAVGVETALFLAEKGTLSGDAVKFLLVKRAEDPDTIYDLATRGTKDVVLIEMLKSIGKDIGLTTRWTIMQDIAATGVKMYNNTKALSITPTGVQVEREGEVHELPCDTVVLAAGAQPNNPLEETVKEMGIKCKVVGDAQKIGLALDAIYQGFEAGRSLPWADDDN